MRYLLTVLLLSFCLTGATWGAQAEEPAKADPLKEIEKSLDKKVTFEFADTPLVQVLAFFRELSNLTFVVDAAITSEKHNPSVNLRVADMSLKTALGWVCKLAECEWEIKDNAVHVFVLKEVLREQAAQEKELRTQQERLETIANTAPARKLRVRFADGTEIEAEGAVFHDQPDLAKKLLDRALDPSRDGILAYKIGDAEEATGLLKRLARLEPKVKGEYDVEGELLFLTADEHLAIRKAAAFMRKLGHYDVEVAVETPPEEQMGGGGDNDEAEEEEQPEQPAAPPREDPARAVNF